MFFFDYGNTESGVRADQLIPVDARLKRHFRQDAIQQTCLELSDIAKLLVPLYWVNKINASQEMERN